MSKPGGSPIRQATLGDVPEIYDVIRENPEEVLPRSYQDIYTHFDRFYVYDKDGIKGVISWAVLPVMNPDSPDKCLEIISFSVRKDFRKKGVGRALLEHMLGLLQGMDPDRVIVLTFYPEFFKKFNFREVSKESLYQKILVGCLHCTKHRSPLTCPESAMEYVINGN